MMRVPESQKLNAIRLDSPMRCHRCGSIMAYEKFYGLQGGFWGWRCVCCGEIIDATILENRSCSIAGRIRRSRVQYERP